MRSVIGTIFSGNSDENVHSDFIKFSKGVFDNRYLIEAKKQKDQFLIKTSYEFANFFVKFGLELCTTKIDINGAIITTLDLRKDFEFPLEHVKQYQGIKQYMINTSLEPKKIISIIDKYPRAFYALSFDAPDYFLKIKAKAPKSGKPSNKGDDEPKADFCSLKTTNKELIQDLFFDVPNFSEITIKHTLNIKEIILPKGITDPKELREKAQRKGTITRIIKIDGKEIKTEKEFLA